MAVEVVGACVNDCCVFCGTLKVVERCPNCDTARLVEGKERKEFRFIPLERQIRHMFADPELAAKLRRDRSDWPQPQPGHVEVTLLCDQLAAGQPCSRQGVIGSPAWKKYVDGDVAFAAEPRNLVVELSFDAFSPFGMDK